jgi:hypothetical protein
MLAKVLFALIALVAMIGAVSASMTLARIVTFDNGTDIVTPDPINAYNTGHYIYHVGEVTIDISGKLPRFMLNDLGVTMHDYYNDFAVFEEITREGHMFHYVHGGTASSVVIISGLDNDKVKDIVSRVTLL